MEVICIRCSRTAVRIVSVDDKTAKVECLTCGKEFAAEIQAAVDAIRKTGSHRGR
jgi:transcription elongation factor Elf1